MRESPFLKHIRLALGGRADVRAFRNTVGMGWHGDARKLATGDVLLKDPRPVTLGLGNDTSDLIGFASVTVTPAMVGQQVAVFMAIEVKGRKTTTTAGQRRFLSLIRKMGGIAMILREGKGEGVIEEEIF